MANAMPIPANSLQEVTTTIANVPKTPGLPWEVWLLVAAIVVPFLFAIGVSIAVAVWARGKMKLDRYLKIFLNGDVILADVPPGKHAINSGDEKHILATGEPKLFMVSRFGWRQPLHVFQQGHSLERDIISKKIPSGKDNENSEYLKAYVDTERAKQIFNLSLNLGFSIILGIACAAVGVLIGLAIAHFSKSPGAAANAATTTTTTITGMIKR